MANELVEPIDKAARRLILAALDQKGIKPGRLAALVGVNRSTIGRILHGQAGATVTNLIKIADALGIPREKLRVQYEIDFAIDERFEALAQRTLKEELIRLRAEVGTVRALRVTGTVGVRFHGISPEERIFERVFALPAPRAQRKRHQGVRRSS